MEEEGQEPEFGDPEKKLVLIIEDDEGERDLLKLLTQKEGFRVEAAEDGSAGLRKALELSPDLILLDLMLPGLAGYEVLKQLQSEGLGNVPIIVVSAKAMDAKTVDNLKQESNVKDFVAKPPAARVFANKLHAALRTRPRAAS